MTISVDKVMLDELELEVTSCRLDRWQSLVQLVPPNLVLRIKANFPDHNLAAEIFLRFLGHVPLGENVSLAQTYGY